MGYFWAHTDKKELFVVLVLGETAYVPGVEDGIDLAQIVLLEPVKWPHPFEAQSQNSDHTKRGAPVRDAMPACVILPFVANG